LSYCLKTVLRVAIIINTLRETLAGTLMEGKLQLFMG